MAQRRLVIFYRYLFFWSSVCKGLQHGLAVDELSFWSAELAAPSTEVPAVSMLLIDIERLMYLSLFVICSGAMGIITSKKYAYT